MIARSRDRVPLSDRLLALIWRGRSGRGFIESAMRSRQRAAPNPRRAVAGPSPAFTAPNLNASVSPVATASFTRGRAAPTDASISARLDRIEALLSEFVKRSDRR